MPPHSTDGARKQTTTTPLNGNYHVEHRKKRTTTTVWQQLRDILVASWFAHRNYLYTITNIPFVPNSRSFWLSRYLVFFMYLDIRYVYIHNTNYISRKATTIYKSNHNVSGSASPYR
jgi:hypothetical protein